MEAVPAVCTLLDEWQWRRDRLDRGPFIAAQLAQEQVRVLDYLIRRYGSSPEAQRPATVTPKMDVEVNHRAIVVFHHVWAGKVGGIKSSEEAHVRVSAILDRMGAHTRTDSCASEGQDVPLPHDPDADIPFDPRAWPTVPRWTRSYRPLRDAVIAAALARDPFLPQSVAQELYERIVKPGKEDVRAAELLVRGRSRHAMKHALHAWRELLASGRIGKAWEVLDRFLAGPEATSALAQDVRESLAHDKARVRLATLALLSRVGGLEDIGLLSDLLAVPLASDEDPNERPALLGTMRTIATRTP